MRGAARDLAFRVGLILKAARVQLRANLRVRKFRPSVRALHVERARLLHQPVVNLVADADRRAAVARGGLDEDALEGRVQENLPVHHRVVGDAARKPEVCDARPLVQVIQDVKGDLFQPSLQTRRDVALAFGKRSALFARGAEGALELFGEDAADGGRALVPTHLDALGVVPEVF